MKIKSQKDFCSGLLFLAAGVAFAVRALNHPFGTSARPGPGLFPFGLGLLLALLGAIVLFKALTLETEGGDPIGAIAWRPLLLVPLSVALFGVTLPRLGLLLALPLVVLLASLAGEGWRWKSVALNALVLVGACWLVLVVGLKIPIPLWPLGPSASGA